MRHCPHISAERRGQGKARAESRPSSTCICCGFQTKGFSFLLPLPPPIFMCPSSAVRSGLGGHGTCYAWPRAPRPSLQCWWSPESPWAGHGCFYLTSRMDGLVSMMATMILSM